MDALVDIGRWEAQRGLGLLRRWLAVTLRHGASLLPAAGDGLYGRGAGATDDDDAAFGPPIAVEGWGQTDIGRVRPTNDDLFALDEKCGVFLVADGMGGHAAGGVAARLVLEEILSRWRARVDRRPPSRLTQALKRKLVEAIQAAHERVVSEALLDRSLDGMGTTVVVAAPVPGTDTVVVGHVGDSRAYLLRGGSLERLTQDHTWTGALVATGLLGEKEAAGHPQRHVLTQALGRGRELDVDVAVVRLEPGDLMLLCSDGLHGMLADAEIAAILSEGGGLSAVTERLVAAANARGGMDNVAVVVLRAAAARQPALGEPGGRRVVTAAD